MTFGERLKQLRKNKNINQIELAEFLNVSQTTIANYESNRRSPSIEYLVEIARYFEVSIDYLVGYNELEKAHDLAPIENQYESSAKEFFKLVKMNNKNQALDFILKLTEEMMIVEIYEFVIIRTLEMIGEAWEKGEVSVVDEHLMTNAIATVIGRLSFVLKDHASHNYKRMISMVPPSEKHTLISQVINNCFEINGWKSYNFAGNTPIIHLTEALNKYKPQVIVISLIMHEYISEVAEMIKEIRKTSLEIKVFVRGKAFSIEKNQWRDIGADNYSDSIQGLIELSEKMIEVE